MRLWRPIALAAAIFLMLVGCVIYVPSLVFHLFVPNDGKPQTAARASIERSVNTFAAQVISYSEAPTGPPADRLKTLADRESLDYAPEGSDGILNTIWVQGGAEADSFLYPQHIEECYAIHLHDLGTPAAGSQITHLKDCKDTLGRIMAGATD